MTMSELKEKTNLNIEMIDCGGYRWINIENPTDKETDFLARHFPFHPLDLDDVLSRRQRPKIDEYRDYLFLVFQFPVYNKQRRVTASSQLSIFIGQDYIITIHTGELKPLTKLFRECQIDAESRQQYFESGTGFLLYRIVDRLVDYCWPIVNKILDNIEDVEEEIFTYDRRRRPIIQIAQLRRDIISFRRTIWPMRAVIGSLEPKLRRFTNRDMTVYFGDVIDHLDKIWDGLDECKEIIEGLNATFDSVSSNRTNEVIRILTILGTILLPLVVITGFYGMNIPLPGQESDNPIIVVVFITVILIGLMLLFFRRIRVI